VGVHGVAVLNVGVHSVDVGSLYLYSACVYIKVEIEDIFPAKAQ
jgi:hypothetical protein